MQFLKTLFWVAVAVVLVLFATENWQAVTVRLWGGLEADIKLPVLVLFSFLIGFLPMLVIHRARLWSLRRRLDAHERQIAAVHGGPSAETEPAAASPAPSPAPPGADRIATDAKAWPAT